MSDDNHERIQIGVTPSPSPHEMAAITAVVAGLATVDGKDEEPVPSGDGREKWRLAARRELLRQMDGHEGERNR